MRWISLFLVATLYRPACSEPIRLFNTGTDLHGAILSGGVVDPNWKIVTGPGVIENSDSFVLKDQRISPPNNPYASSPDSLWIGVRADGESEINIPYVFRQEFDLTGLDPDTASINGSWAVDNNGIIRLNGLESNIGTGFLSIEGDKGSSSNWGVLHEFTINQGFQDGINTLEIEMINLNGPAGLQISSLVGNAEAKPRIPGDFNAALVLSVVDIDYLIQGIRNGTDLVLDLNDDALVNSNDLAFWISELKRTYFGDANLDGVFNSTDLVEVFNSGEYEDDVVSNSTWGEGDWNADGDFTTRDMVLAFQDGGYEQGPRAALPTVPEPASLTLFMAGVGSLLFCRDIGRRYCVS
ncbi:MAG: hypothetical protein KDB23_18705 [Planctomycetales bacterium]|nr:hypothetical protein [Planctomycetales bacterium]